MSKTKTTKTMQEQVLDKMVVYHIALIRIASIRNKRDGGDWDEIEEARNIANEALANV